MCTWCLHPELSQSRPFPRERLLCASLSLSPVRFLPDPGFVPCSFGARCCPTVVDVVGETSGGESSLTLDLGGYPHVAFRSAPNGGIAYARLKDGGWEQVLLDPQADAHYPYLELDADELAHIGYNVVTPVTDSPPLFEPDSGHRVRCWKYE